LSLLFRDFVSLGGQKVLKGLNRPADEGLCGSALKYVINILKKGDLWVVPT
jgi:hypothetical protein